MVKLYWVTNIPSPYRNHRYRTMAEVFPRHGVDFEVLYMARTEPNRHWDMPAEQFAYPHHVFRGLHPVVKGWAGHLNPGMLAKLRLDPPDIVLIGGFACPTHWLAHPATPRRTTKVMMVESNLDSARMTNAASRAFKRAMILPNRAFVVPGPRSWDYVLDIAPEVADRPRFQLPNLVDPSVWVEEVGEKRTKRAEIRRELGCADDERLWVCPARLVEDKGLHRFLPELAGLSGFRLFIAGDGPLRETLEAQVRSDGSPVTFLGPQPQAKMVELYAAADLFVLPSLRDPSPLSVVEASASRLPLLLSTRIGNLDDLLEPGKNGLSFDVTQPGDARGAAEAALRWSPAERRAMGDVSHARYLANFDSRARLGALADFFRDVHGR